MLTHRDSMLCKVYQTTNETIVILKDATKQLSLRLSTVPMYNEAPKIGCNLFRRETLTHHGYEKESTDCIPRSLLVCCHVRLCHGTYPSYENGEESHVAQLHGQSSLLRKWLSKLTNALRPHAWQSEAESSVIAQEWNFYQRRGCQLPKTLNGPYGNVASETVVSVKMLKYGLENLQQVSKLYGYVSLNLLSCMTLDVENNHSVVHHKKKDPLCTVLNYARKFGNAAKEGLKRTTR